MSYGFMGQLLRVDLTNHTITVEEINQTWAKQYLGGTGLATKYFYEEVPSGIDPLGPENKLIFMTGPLTGTASASASRYSVVAKSPQTNLWGQANSGGSFGPVLKKSGYDGIIFEGVSPTPVALQIIDGKAELLDASHLWGKTVPDTEDALQDSISQKLTVAAIGQAGENLVTYAAIMNNKHRAAGRCGLGAVMGSKKLKAIACVGSQPVQLADKKGFHDAATKQFDLIDESMLKVGFDAFGTNMVADFVHVRGGYPTMNWQQGVFDGIDDVNAQAIMDTVFVEGTRCFACPITCGRGTEIKEGKWKGDKGEGPEYESTNTLGSMCGVSDINAITKSNYLCNEYGLDTISTGATIAFAMECFEKGIITKEQTDGLEITFGDGDMVVALVKKIAIREGIGDLLAKGTKAVAEKLGQGSEKFAMHVKGLELPAYDSRAAKITGLGYVTANRGGDHMTGYIQGPTFMDIPFLIVDDSSIRDPFQANPEEAHVLVDMENALTVLDAFGGCKFMGMLLPADELLDLYVKATGWSTTVEDFRKAGERIYNLTRAACVREGASREDDVLPERLMAQPIPGGPAEGMVNDPEMLELMKDAYYDFRGWDSATGIPTQEKLRELDLEDLIPDLWG
ncbi:MAG: aldehyde ferredoxin oxidoreductase family protein [Anaerolineales bacterium]|uniref:Aldehyde ferredoxin oxidoreductase family protein n=1 Tax=Candidatus Desulfolinea nitratireducens TaxID=2841698 RepID=A0A8J6NHB6_9CHLR|nr:aldehyde ferredoxin oxidoreductase family protein [Candidatus Desulfolinea nitratireducens]MBL6961104.1 aldehyde ferredoxin oxidoreductase family protein [Anaerolineales bacterium]